MLKTSQTARGASVASHGAMPPPWSCGMEGERSRVKHSFTKVQASRPWIHAAFRSCGTRAAFTAAKVCYPCWGKAIRHVQRHQHYSTTEPRIMEHGQRPADHGNQTIRLEKLCSSKRIADFPFVRGRGSGGKNGEMTCCQVDRLMLLLKMFDAII